jgi:polysaccharide pyruvyl transferase WcaK-like protein
MRSIGVFNDTSVTRHFGCQAVMSVLEANLRARGMAPAYHWPVAVDWRPYAETLRHHKVAAIVVNGEGSIHHSAARPRAGQLVALADFAHDVMGVPCFLLNASVQELEQQCLSRLSRFDAIYVRESKSERYLHENGIAASVVPDLSFGFDLSHLGVVNRDGVTVTDSVLPDVSRRMRQFARSQRARFAELRGHEMLTDRLLRKIWRKPPVENTIWHRKFNIEATRAFVAQVAASELVVSGRFHATTLSILTQTPVLSIPSNTWKVESLITDVFGATDRRIVELVSLVGAGRRDIAGSAQYTTDEQSAIQEYLRSTRVRVSDAFDAIAAKLAN